jgi:tRNA dimethylallyltransferase
MSVLQRLIVVLGPTASGKSALGIHIAEKLGGEILVCDSTQVYRHFNIGTAKVPAAERRGIAHHLVDLIEPTETFTAGDYRRCALEALGDLLRRGISPILTAGTGLYLRALLEGLADAPQRSEKIRARLRGIAEKRGFEYLHRALARLDPESAARISAADVQKTIRAIELRLLTGKPMSEIHRSGRDKLQGYEIIKIGLLPPRAALYARIHQRTAAMLAAGWLEEVRTLVASGVPADAKPFQFIGYAQLREHLAGRLSEKDAVHQIQQATRRFAKRQLTWFRKEAGVHWLAGFGDAPEISAAALSIASNNPLT